MSIYRIKRGVNVEGATEVEGNVIPSDALQTTTVELSISL